MRCAIAINAHGVHRRGALRHGADLPQELHAEKRNLESCGIARTGVEVKIFDAEAADDNAYKQQFQAVIGA